MNAVECASLRTLGALFETVHSHTGLTMVETGGATLLCYRKRIDVRTINPNQNPGPRKEDQNSLRHLPFPATKKGSHAMFREPIR